MYIVTTEMFDACKAVTTNTRNFFFKHEKNALRFIDDRFKRYVVKRDWMGITDIDTEFGSTKGIRKVWHVVDPNDKNAHVGDASDFDIICAYIYPIVPLEDRGLLSECPIPSPYPWEV